VDGIIVFLAVSDLHLKYKLHTDLATSVAMAGDTIDYAKSHGVFVQLSAEDATRTSIGNLTALFNAAKERGADRLGIADTTGCIRPQGMRYLVEKLRKNFDIELSAHCHDDFGLAVANSLAAYEAGIDALSLSVNGLGSGAGTPRWRRSSCLSTRSTASTWATRLPSSRALGDGLEVLRIPIPINKARSSDRTPSARIRHTCRRGHQMPLHLRILRATGSRAGEEAHLRAPLRIRGVRRKLKSMGMQVTDKELAEIIKALKTMPVDASPIDNGGLLAFVNAVLNRKG
jgi:methanogen homocitrate synthase